MTIQAVAPVHPVAVFQDGIHDLDAVVPVDVPQCRSVIEAAARRKARHRDACDGLRHEHVPKREVGPSTPPMPGSMGGPMERSA